MKRISVIIADDHRLMREALTLFISTDRRIRVIADCGSGEKAVELSKRFSPELVILDINLPGINGIDAAHLIKKHSPETKILAVSMHSHPSYMIEMFKQGATGYVTKSSSGEEITEAIEAVLCGEKYICKEIKNILSHETKGRHSSMARFEALSRREFEIVSLVNKGNTSKEIAELLNIAKKTVEAHRYNVMKKLNLKSSAALIYLMHYSGIGSENVGLD